MRGVLLFLLIASLALAKEYAVVANTRLALHTITQKELRPIFLKKRRFINNTKLVVLNQKPNSAIRNSFEHKILQMSRQRLRRYWTAQHYRGHRPPIQLPSDASVIKFVQKVEGAIGYVERSSIPKNAEIRIIFSWSE